jgi:hypothetical protein
MLANLGLPAFIAYGVLVGEVAAPICPGLPKISDRPVNHEYPE